jgi:anti-sigma-K factor RskA
VAVAVIAMVVGTDQRTQLAAQIASLQTQLQATPQIEYVAVLADGKADASMLVTFDPKNKKLLLQRVGGYQEASDKSLQLWALPPQGGPRSLGVLGSDKLLRLTAGEGDVHAVPTLAISLEPKGGVPSAGGPTGPVLFKGALIQKML